MSHPAGYSSDEDFGHESSSSFSNKILTTENTFDKNSSSSLNEDLIDAIIEGHVQQAIQLIIEGANVNYKSNRQPFWTPLMEASSNASRELVSFLIQHGARVNDTDQQHFMTPLLCVCNSLSNDEDQLIECLQLLITNGAELGAVDLNKTGCLTLAVKRNHEKIVLTLISLGCEIDKQDSDGRPAIFYAVSLGKLKLVEILKDAGAKIDQVDKNNLTLHEIALSQHDHEIADLIKIEKICDVDEILERRKGHKVGSYEFVLSELNNPIHGRFFGFHSVAVKWINGLHGISHLTDLFIQNNVQLSELLTMNDEDLINIGVRYSFDRKKICYYVQKLLEHSWGNKINRAPKENENVDLNMVADIISNVVGQVHVISSAVYLSNIKINKNKISKNSHRDISKGLFVVRLFKNELLTFLKLAKETDESDVVTPADFISPQGGCKHSFSKWIFFSLINLTFIFYKNFQPLTQQVYYNYFLKWFS